MSMSHADQVDAKYRGQMRKLPSIQNLGHSIGSTYGTVPVYALAIMRSRTPSASVRDLGLGVAVLLSCIIFATFIHYMNWSTMALLNVSIQSGK